jgi:hypothetical protein
MSIDNLIKELYNLPPGKPFTSHAKKFSDEESRLLKAHINGALTKYINNLKLVNNSVPFMYDYMQSVIGVATLIFYYCAAPAICVELAGTTIEDFHYLCFDKIFRKRWLYSKQVKHLHNTFSTANNVNNYKNDSEYAETEKTLQFRLDKTTADLSGKIFYDLLIGTGARYTNEKGDILSPYHTNFINRISQIGTFLSSHTLSDCIVKNNSEFIKCMEDLRTIYIFYYKGGNSIRTIIETTNTYVHPDLQINDLDKLIPYGSDFDTNFLINPYLPNEKFNNIKQIIELFIPIISQFIIIPKEFYESLKNPKEDIFTGDSDKSEQELQMKILSQHYMLNNEYIFDKYRTKVIESIEKEKKRLFFMNPQISAMDDTIVRTKINTGYEVIQSSIIPKLNYVDHKEDTFENLIRRHYPLVMRDTCNNSLQYSVNKSIPKFELYRYFLNFKLGERITKTTLKHRLINITGIFNAEMLDISIVMPVYIPDKDDKTVTCELLELWQHSGDIYKIAVFDKYRIINELKKKLPTFGKTVFVRIPVFVNSIDIQIEDLKQAVKDTLYEKKFEKVPKRIKRLRALQYTKLISPFYNKDPVRDILISNDISELDVAIPDDFLDILGVNKETIHNEANIHKRKHIRVLYEYYWSTINSSFYKFIENHDTLTIWTTKDKSKPLSLKEFFAYLLNIFWKAFDLNDGSYPKFFKYVKERFGNSNNEQFTNTVYEFHVMIIEMFDNMILYQDGDKYEWFAQDSDFGKSDLSSHFDFELYYTKLVIVVPPNGLDTALSSILKDPENDYRISGFFYTYLARSYETSLTIAKQNLHRSSQYFIDSSLRTVESVPGWRPALVTPVDNQQVSIVFDEYEIVNKDHLYLKFLIIVGLSQISTILTYMRLQLQGAYDPNQYLSITLDGFYTVFEYLKNNNVDSISFEFNGKDLKDLLVSMYNIYIESNGTQIINENLYNYFVPQPIPENPILYIDVYEPEQRYIEDNVTIENEFVMNNLFYRGDQFIYNHFLYLLFGSPIYTPISLPEEYNQNTFLFYIADGTTVISGLLSDDGNTWGHQGMELLSATIYASDTTTVLLRSTDLMDLTGGRRNNPRRNTRRQKRTLRKHTFKKNKRTNVKRTYKRKLKSAT